MKILGLWIHPMMLGEESAAGASAIIATKDTAPMSGLSLRIHCLSSKMALAKNLTGINCWLVSEFHAPKDQSLPQKLNG
jgi:hypothetical protein